jgi:NAD(P)-dependent dehydrogenase (short-subunit alcohol dehydrogenase family)
MAEGLARAGASVVVASRNQSRCEREAEAIAEATGRDVLAAACHMGDWDAIPAFVDRVYDRFGQVDDLVNNAGIQPAMPSVVELTNELFDKIFAVNLKGPVRLAGLVAPGMRDGGGRQHHQRVDDRRLLGRPRSWRLHVGESRLAQLHQGDGEGMGFLGNQGQCTVPRAVQLRADEG